MRTEQEAKEYLSSHYFINRIHAHAVRSAVMDKFKSKEFEFKYASTDRVEFMGVYNKIITANDALKYIWDEKDELLCDKEV